MNRSWVRGFTHQFKNLFEVDGVVIYEEDVCEKMQDMFDTLPVRYKMDIVRVEIFDCDSYFFQIVGNNNKEEFITLASHIEYLLNYNISIVKSYDEYNNICNFLGRLGIKHGREVETNFANERIWVIGIDREWK